jgi:hypothetical protein
MPARQRACSSHFSGCPPHTDAFIHLPEVWHSLRQPPFSPSNSNRFYTFLKAMSSFEKSLKFLSARENPALYITQGKRTAANEGEETVLCDKQTTRSLHMRFSPDWPYTISLGTTVLSMSDGNAKLTPEPARFRIEALCPRLQCVAINCNSGRTALGVTQFRPIIGTSKSSAHKPLSANHTSASTLSRECGGVHTYQQATARQQRAPGIACAHVQASFISVAKTEFRSSTKPSLQNLSQTHRVLKLRFTLKTASTLDDMSPGSSLKDQITQRCARPIPSDSTHGTHHI